MSSNPYVMQNFADGPKPFENMQAENDRVKAQEQQNLDMKRRAEELDNMVKSMEQIARSAVDAT